MRNMWNRTASKVILSNNPWITELMATQDAGQVNPNRIPHQVYLINTEPLLMASREYQHFHAIYNTKHYFLPFLCQGDTKKLQTNVIDKAKDKPTTQKKAAKNNSQSKDRVHFDVQSVRTTASQVMYKTDHVKTELDNLKPVRYSIPIVVIS